METQKSPNSKHNPEKELSQRHHSSWFQTILQSTVIKTVWNKNRQNLQTHNIQKYQKQTHKSVEHRKEPRKTNYTYVAINLQEERQEYAMCILHKLYWENWTATCNRMKLDYFFILYINSKWIEDLHVRPKP